MKKIKKNGFDDWIGFCVDARFVTFFLLINVDVRRRGYASCFKKKM